MYRTHVDGDGQSGVYFWDRIHEPNIDAFSLTCSISSYQSMHGKCTLWQSIYHALKSPNPLPVTFAFFLLGRPRLAARPVAVPLAVVPGAITAGRFSRALSHVEVFAAVAGAGVCCTFMYRPTPVPPAAVEAATTRSNSCAASFFNAAASFASCSALASVTRSKNGSTNTLVSLMVISVKGRSLSST